MTVIQFNITVYLVTNDETQSKMEYRETKTKILEDS